MRAQRPAEQAWRWRSEPGLGSERRPSSLSRSGQDGCFWSQPGLEPRLGVREPVCLPRRMSSQFQAPGWLVQLELSGAPQTICCGSWWLPAGSGGRLAPRGPAFCWTRTSSPVRDRQLKGRDTPWEDGPGHWLPKPLRPTTDSRGGARWETAAVRPGALGVEDAVPRRKLVDRVPLRVTGNTPNCLTSRSKLPIWGK